MLRYRGAGAPPAAQVARVRALAGAEVVDDEGSPKMLLVDADPDALMELVEELGDWVAAPDRSYPVPDTRQRIQRPPE